MMAILDGSAFVTISLMVITKLIRCRHYSQGLTSSATKTRTKRKAVLLLVRKLPGFRREWAQKWLGNIALLKIVYLIC